MTALVDAYLRRHAAALGASDAHDLAAFCGWLAARDSTLPLDAALHAFDADDLGAFIAEQLGSLRGRRRDPSIVYRRLVALGRFYAWAADIGAVPASPVPPERWAGRPTSPAGRAAG